VPRSGNTSLSSGGSSDQYGWSRKSLAELVAFYWDEIAPEMRRDGLTPDEEWPRYEWLLDRGYGGLDYALRTHHDLTLREFFVDVCGVDEETREGYEWGFDHDRTRAAIEGYLEEGDWEGLSPQTLRSRRTHIARYVRVYERLHGMADVVDPLQAVERKRRETKRVRAVADALAEELAPRTLVKYLQDVQRWYREYLAEYESAAYDPTRKLTKPYDVPDPDNRPLSAEQVRRLYDAADDLAERLTVVALAGWGLRRGEVASLHVSQFQLDADHPHLTFDHRKNADADGPSTVAIVYGLDEAAARMDALDAAGWNGYLFPSSTAASGHVHGSTVYRRFKRLAEKAGVRVDGDLPHPHQGRRFWYDAYRDAVADLIDLAQEIADDQGASDPRTVYENYWSEQRRRALRRDAMKDRLRKTFEGAGSVGPGE